MRNLRYASDFSSLFMFYGAIFVFSCLAVFPAHAVTGADVAPGAACSVEDAVMVTANPSGVGGYVLTCESSVWVANITGATPTNAAHYATKAYVDSVAAGGDADTVDGLHAVDIQKQPVDTPLNNTHDLDALSDGWYSWALSLPTNSHGDSYMSMLQLSDINQKIQFSFGGSGSGKIYVRRADSGTFYPWTRFLSVEDEGSGNGLDADTLDGVDSASFWQASNDGAGSGLDADTLDTLNSTQFLRSDVDDTGTNLTLSSMTATSINGLLWEGGVNRITHNDGGGNVQIRLGNEYNGGHKFTHGGGAAFITSNIDATSNTSMTLQVSSNPGAGTGTAVTWGSDLTLTATDLTFGGNTIWRADNDGSGSTLDADTLDGVDSASFWQAGNDGAGSGLDADTVDGLQAASFIRADAADVVTGGSTTWNDNNYVRLGTGADFRMYHNATNTIFRSYLHGAQWRLQGENAGGTNLSMIIADPDNAVTLYYAGANKLATSADGINIDVTSSSTSGIEFDGASALTGYTGNWLRLNQDNAFTSGTYTPGKLRADGGLYVSDDEYFYASAEDVIRTTDAFQLASGTSVNEFSTDGTLSGNSNNAVPTEAAVKTYVDAAAASGGGSCAVLEGTYFANGGFDVYCQRKTINADGEVNFYSINQGATCDTGKFCYDGACVSSTGLTCSSVGDTCADGTIYAGTSPSGGTMYITKSRQDSKSWSPASSTYGISPDSNTNGEANAANRTNGNLSAYYAIQLCENLVSGGKSDWYLPAKDELVAIAGNSGSLSAYLGSSLNHWSSTEYLSSSSAYFVNLTSGTANYGSKTNTYFMRCVRR